MKTIRITALIIGIMTMFTSNVANAAFLNLGTLDVRPLRENGANAEWFVEYGDRGQNMIRYIQIANFSPEKKEVDLYVSDSTTTTPETNFTVNAKEESSEKISPWISVPATSLTLDGGETKIVPVSIRIPENAGVGLHAGAVIVREKTKADGTQFHVEKGVRLYLNVKGAVVENAVLTDGRINQSLGNMGLNLEVENKGTTDFDSPLTMELRNMNGETVAAQTLNGYIRPGEKAEIKLSAATPAFGIYHATLTSGQPLNGETSLSAGTFIAVPLWFLVAMAAMAMGCSVFTVKFNFGKILSGAQFQKAGSFLGILLVSGLMSLPLVNMDGTRNFFAAVLGTTNPESYEVTVKWGNLRKLILSKKNTTEWHGKITLTGAKATIKNTLDLEENDDVNLVDEGSTVGFNLTTDTNNDGVVLDIVPTGDTAPTLTFENYPTNINRTINLSKLVGGKTTIANGSAGVAIFIKSITLAELHGASMLTELNATPEAQATPEVFINIPELKSIFEDIPATPEVLSEFILTSNYVKKISTENALTKIETDSALIRALEATPEIIDEIAATPSLNFTFIPSETITFPPQQFSFKQDKTSIQDLGTIIFVQNKETPWNTYMGTTNFISSSGRGIIPAGSLTVIPGEAKILSQLDGTQVSEGTEKTMQGTFDKSILVNVDPGTDMTDSKTIFTMNPKLSINIPHGTPPGKYRGLLTITSL